MLSSQLLETLEKLSPDLQTEILHYAEYLVTRYTKDLVSEQAIQKYRRAGTMKGIFTMANDFDAPLEDLKDYI